MIVSDQQQSLKGISCDDLPAESSINQQSTPIMEESKIVTSPLVCKEKKDDGNESVETNEGNKNEGTRSSIILNGKYSSNNKLLQKHKTNKRRLSWVDMPSEETHSSSHANPHEESDYERGLSSRISGISTNSSIQDSDTPKPRSKKISSNPNCNADVKRKLSIISNPMACMKDDEISEVIIEQKKSRAIWCLRTLTLTTLVTATVIVAVLTYQFTRNAELQVFNTQYQDSVVKVAEAISLDISNKLNSAMSFSAMYTSRYGPENKWPNITLPYFQEQAKGLLDTSGGIALSFNPIITNKTRTEWEAYATEFAPMLGAEELVERSCDSCRVVADGIYRKVDGIAVDDSGYSPKSRFPYHMVPVWQIYPTIVNWRAVMFNLHSEINRQRALDDMMEYKVPTVTGLLHLVQHVEMDPSSILFYPVVDRFHSSPFFKSVVGSISIVFTWADILRSVLPGYIKGLIVVLEKSTHDTQDAQSFTYSISGENVTLLGEGDLHNPTYDEYEHVVIANVAQDAVDLGIVDFLVTYKLRIYPSREFEDSYLTIRPLAMTLVVVVLFIFTSGVFLTYDYLVYNRQNETMKNAQRSGHIVNSLFPSGVRERLFTSTDHHIRNQTILDDNEASSGNDNQSLNVLSSHQKRNPAYLIKQFLKGNFQKNESSTSIHSQQSGVHGYIQNTPPIADLFHNTTIMFADMVSFTAWSSEHAPEDVFYLLETLFLEFDKAAERLGVFKLGTIGDCYVAVTGVPDPRDDHAVVMAKFAEECRSKTNRVLSELVNEFGPSVNNLSMRFGLHSGSVTAGVLRGLKSRFELFGDTINTASRMESTGRPNMIQISEETATLLEYRGYKHWFGPREDLVYAKGKGELQTYWLDINVDENALSECFPTPRTMTDSQPSFVHEIYSESQCIEDDSNDNNFFDNDCEQSRISSSSSIYVEPSMKNEV